MDLETAVSVLKQWLKNNSEKLELEKDKEGNILIPFSAVIATGDFMVVSEEDIL